MSVIKTIAQQIRRIPVNPGYLLWLLVFALLYWALQDVKWSAVLSTLQQLSVTQLLVLGVVNILVYLTIVGRWWLLLIQQQIQLSPLLLLRYWLIGFAFSYLMPGPQLGGGILQIYFLQHNHDVSAGLAASSVTTSKLLERLGNFLFMGLGLYAIVRFGLLPASQTGPLMWVLLGIALLPFAYLSALWLGRQPLTALFDRLLARGQQKPRLRRAAQFANIMESEIGQLCREAPLALIAGLALSLLGWLLVLGLTWLALTYLQVPVDPFAPLVIVAAVQLAFLVPLPLGLGSVEAIAVTLFQGLGLEASQAISLILLMRLRDFVVAGFGLLLGGRASWRWWRSEGKIQET
jgi:uncharacterized protein (TIRG00374 family)